MNVNNTMLAGGVSDFSAGAIIAAAQAGLGNGFAEGDVAIRGSMTKDIKLPPPQQSDGGGGGIFGFLSSILKPIASLLSFIPGFGTMASFVLNLASGVLATVGSLVQTGKVKAGQILETVGNAVLGMIPGGALTGLGGMGLKAIAGMLDSGRIDPAGLAAGFGKLLEGLPGGGLARVAIDAGTNVIAGALRTGRFDPTALLQAATQVAGTQIAGGGGDALAAIAGQFDAGALPGKQLQQLLQPLIGQLGLDPAGARLLDSLLRQTVAALGNGDITARDVTRAMIAGVGDRA